MDDVQSSVFQIVINFLSESFVGKILMTFVVLLIICAPAFKFFIKEFKEYKEKQEKKEKELEDQKKADIERQKLEYARTEQFRSGVENNLKNIDKLAQEINHIEDELEKIKLIKGELSDDLHTCVNDLNKRMDTDKEHSDSQDVMLKENLTEIGNQLNEMKDNVEAVTQSAKDVENDLKIIFEGENNEFRVYISQIHEKFISKGVPVPRDVKQQLRIKFDMYKKRKGNGWAEDMYNEIINASTGNE